MNMKDLLLNSATQNYLVVDDMGRIPFPYLYSLLYNTMHTKSHTNSNNNTIPKNGISGLSSNLSV